jgi:RHS repeat-associated protein
MRRRQPQTSSLVNKLTRVSMPRAGYTQTRSFVYNNDQRLASATNPENGTVTYSYNGDGSLARKTDAKGQWIDYGYDAKGNVTATPALALSYDVENRLVEANQEHYGYGPGNQRVWKQWPDGHEEVYFWGPDGRKLGSYRPTESWTGNEGDPHIFVFQTVQNYLYFAGQLVGESAAPQCTEREEGECIHWVLSPVSGIALDRLGSVRARTRPWMQPPYNLLRSSYYPYGEERQTTEQDRDKFATYHRDSTTGLDYASQRYYSSLTGRFLTPDPYLSTTCRVNPQAWNRYAYVHGDPVNFYDPSGNNEADPNPPTAGGGFYVGMGYSTVWGPEGSVTVPTATLIPNPAPAPAGTTAGTADSRPVKDYVTTLMVRRLLQRRLATFEESNCAEVFAQVIEGFSVAGFISTANQTAFYNARVMPFANYTQNQVVGNEVQTTLNMSVPRGTDAVTIAGPQGTAVLLGPNFFSSTSADFQWAVLLHELLHAYTHWDDADIFKYFRRFGLQQVNEGTGDITAWLERDCQPL